MRAYRVDKNQREIVEGLRKDGYSVQHLHKVGEGCPDIIVGHSENGVKYNFLMEIKEGDGKLTPQQVIWHSCWRGQAVIVRNLEEAINAIKQETKKA